MCLAACRRGSSTTSSLCAPLTCCGPGVPTVRPNKCLCACRGLPCVVCTCSFRHAAPLQLPAQLESGSVRLGLPCPRSWKCRSSIKPSRRCIYCASEKASPARYTHYAHTSTPHVPTCRSPLALPLTPPLCVTRSRYPCKPPLDPPAITTRAINRSFRHLEDAGAHAPPAPASGGGGAGAGGGYGAAAGPAWNCGVCTCANAATALVCAACGSHRPAAAASRAGGDPWHCGTCTFLNDARALACATCGAPRGAAPAHAAAAAPAASYVATPVAPSAPPAAATAVAGGDAGGMTVTASADAERLAKELESMKDEVTCAVCMERRKNVVFGCGHQVSVARVPTCAACAYVADGAATTFDNCRRDRSWLTGAIGTRGAGVR